MSMGLLVAYGDPVEQACRYRAIFSRERYSEFTGKLISPRILQLIYTDTRTHTHTYTYTYTYAHTHTHTYRHRY